jgi:acyl carrier protein
MDKTQIKKDLISYFQDSAGFLPGEEDNLFEKGALDSFGVVEFLNFLEKRFGIQVPLEDITETNFSTVDSVADLIDRQFDGNQARGGKTDGTA